MNPQSPEVAQAADLVRRGGLVVYPTETLYGVGADATNPSALERLVAVKGREIGKPIAVLVADEAMLAMLVAEIPVPAQRLMRKFWPGPLTLVLPARSEVSPLLTGGSGSIGARVSSSAVAGELVRQLGRPLTSPSANPAGGEPALDIVEARQYFGDEIDLYVDGGRLRGEAASTVVRWVGDTLEVIREGAIAACDVIRCVEDR